MALSSLTRKQDYQLNTHTMKTRIIWTKIWDDEWFDALTTNARYLFIYLLTNQDIGLSGCYYITNKKIGFHTHLSNKEIEEAKALLPPKVVFKDNWVYVPNARGYNGFVGAKNDTAVEREIELIPENIRIALSIEKPYRVSGVPNTSIIKTINHNHNNNQKHIRAKAYKLIGNTMVEE